MAVKNEKNLKLFLKRSHLLTIYNFLKKVFTKTKIEKKKKIGNKFSKSKFRFRILKLDSVICVYVQKRQYFKKKNKYN